MIGAAKLVDKVKAGKAKLNGNIQVLEQLKATLVAFDPLFEVLPGTKPAAAPAVMRIYLPTPEVLNGTWKQTLLQRIR
jgi:alkyl sulfatase BDS1-like metallo-beta-lactamase superfamily hydrolase